MLAERMTGSTRYTRKRRLLAQAPGEIASQGVAPLSTSHALAKPTLRWWRKWLPRASRQGHRASATVQAT